MPEYGTVEPPDDTTELVVSRCGCIGLKQYTYSGPHPSVGVLVQQPCRDGHPTRVAAGVIERFLPGMVRPYNP